MFRDFFSETKNRILVGLILLFIILTIVILVASNKRATRVKNIDDNTAKEYTYNGENQEIGVIGNDTAFPGLVTLTYGGDMIVQISNAESSFSAEFLDDPSYLAISTYDGVKEDETKYQEFFISFHEWNNSDVYAQKIQKNVMNSVGAGEYLDITDKVNEDYIIDDSHLKTDDENVSLPAVMQFSLVNVRESLSYIFTVRVEVDGNLTLVSSKKGDAKKDIQTIEGYDILAKQFPKFEVSDAYQVISISERLLFKESEINGCIVYVVKDKDISEVFVTDSDNEAAVLSVYQSKGAEVTKQNIAGVDVTVVKTKSGNYKAFYSKSGMLIHIGDFESQQILVDAVSAWIKD